jgi:hypothetical protein
LNLPYTFLFLDDCDDTCNCVLINLKKMLRLLVGGCRCVGGSLINGASTAVQAAPSTAPRFTLQFLPLVPTLQQQPLRLISFYKGNLFPSLKECYIRGGTSITQYQVPCTIYMP